MLYNDDSEEMLKVSITFSHFKCLLVLVSLYPFSWKHLDLFSNSLLCLVIAFSVISWLFPVRCLHNSLIWFSKIQIICTVRKHIMTGGPKRLLFTVPPLVFSALRVSFFYFQLVSLLYQCIHLYSTWIWYIQLYKNMRQCIWGWGIRT